MSETEADRRYYQAAEAAFIRRRGTPFLLSPKDFTLLEQWRALGVPIEAIEQGIDEAFSRREERSAVGRVNSLTYCAGAVLEAWERRAETSVGRGPARPPLEKPDVPGTLEKLAAGLADLLRRRPDLTEPVGSALRSLERLAKSGKNAEDTEASLVRLDKRLAREIYGGLREPERRRLDEDVEASLRRARVRMDAGAAERTARALTRRKLRELLDLPRLTLI